MWSLEDLGNVGEVVGGLAVVISVLYLAVQIRQSSRIARFDAHRSLSVSMSSIIGDVARNPELYRVWKAVIDEPETASYDDRERFGMLLYQVFTTFSDAYRFADIDNDLATRYEIYIDQYLKMPAVQSWWSRQGNNFPERFRHIINERLAEHAAADG